jgi:hypothetical protein
MCALALAPEEKKVNRSELRKNQSRVLRQATGQTVVVVTSHSQDEDAKYIVDKRYWDDLLGKLKELKDTLEITADPKLFGQILRAADTVDEDIRLGKLHSFEEAFEED